MTKMVKKAVFLSVSSDIASYIASKFIEIGIEVSGTYRNKSKQLDVTKEKEKNFLQVDFKEKNEIVKIKDFAPFENWDFLMVSPATMLPIGKFGECDWNEWEDSFKLNSLRQFHAIHLLLEKRNRDHKPIIFLWSGPGTNNSPLNYSAEIIGKIAQIKFCEILDAEYSDITTVIVGPGWVNTKAHKETIDNPNGAGSNYARTVQKINSSETTPLERIYKFVEWVIQQPKEIVSGRNFSIRGDLWGDCKLQEHLKSNKDSFKLRRCNNDWRPENFVPDYDPK